MKRDVSGLIEILLVVSIVSTLLASVFLNRADPIDAVVGAALKVDGITYYYLPMPNCGSGEQPPRIVRWKGQCWVAVMDADGNLVYPELEVK